MSGKQGKKQAAAKGKTGNAKAPKASKGSKAAGTATASKAPKAVKAATGAATGKAAGIKSNVKGIKGAEGNPFRESSAYATAFNVLASHKDGLRRDEFITALAKATGKDLKHAGYDAAVLLSAKESNTGPRHPSCREGFWIKKVNDHVTLVIDGGGKVGKANRTAKAAKPTPPPANPDKPEAPATDTKEPAAAAAATAAA